MKSTFSIVICNYNYRNYVGDAILSALKQSYCTSLYEIIIVDDGSDDNSIEVINKFKYFKNVTVIQHNRNYGQCRSFHSGISASKYDWICLLDSDDFFFPNKLEDLASYINNSSNSPSFICHNVDLWSASANLNESWFTRNKIEKSSTTVNEIKNTYPFSIPCGLSFKSNIIKNVIKEIPLKTWKRGADNPIAWGSFLLTGKVDYLHKTLSTYRIHDSNYFMGLSNDGFTPKINYLDRWPSLIEFIEKFKSTNFLYDEQNYNKIKILDFLHNSYKD